MSHSIDSITTRTSEASMPFMI